MMRKLAFAVVIVLILAIAGASHAQFGDILGGLGNAKLPDLNIGLKEESPITTSFDDALTSVPFLDDYRPERIFPVCEMPKGPGGGYIVQPGVYRLQLWSYCLHAGTYGPSKGSGYLLAPLKGKRAKIIQAILDRSVDHRDIEQHDIQVLIWAILARTKITEMNPEMQAVAAKLLTDKELLELQGGVLGLVPPEMWNKAFGSLPPGVRDIYEAEAKLRDKLTTGYSGYDELERIAVLTGDPPGEKGPTIPRGRWSVHPDGYFVRFFPHGYSNMHMEMMLPQQCEIARDSTGRIIKITSSSGGALELAYDDTAAPLVFKGAKGVSGYAIKSVTLSRTGWINPSERDSSTWNTPGWTIVGNPGKSSPQGGGSYSGASEYSAFAGEMSGELDSLLKTAPKGSVDAGMSKDIYDLAMLGYALKRITGFQTPERLGEEEFPAGSPGYDVAYADLNQAPPAGLMAGPGQAEDTADAIRLVYDASADRILRTLAPTTYGTMLASNGAGNTLIATTGSGGIASGGNGVASFGNGSPFTAFTLSSHLTSYHAVLTGDLGVFSRQPAFAWPDGALLSNGVFAGGRTLPEFHGNGVAAPANRSSQRLALSPHDNDDDESPRTHREIPPYNPDQPRNPDEPEKPKDSPGKDGFDKLRKVLDWFGWGNNAADVLASGAAGAAANQVGMGIPSYGMGKVIDFNVNTYEQASNALAGDPPDPDYKRIADATIPEFQHVTTADGCSQARADAVNAFAQASLQANAYARAAAQSLDRHGGALKAGDAEWIYTQRNAILHFKHMAGVGYLDTAGKLEALIGVLRPEGVTDIVVTPDAMRTYQSRLQASGWTQFEIDAMRSLGYTDAEMSALLQKRLSASPEEASGSLMAHSEWLVVVLRDVGSYLAALPDAGMPGG